MYPWDPLNSAARHYHCHCHGGTSTWHVDGGRLCLFCGQPGIPGYPPLPATRPTDVTYRTRYGDLPREPG